MVSSRRVQDAKRIQWWLRCALHLEIPPVFFPWCFRDGEVTGREANRTGSTVGSHGKLSRMTSIHQRRITCGLTMPRRIGSPLAFQRILSWKMPVAACDETMGLLISGPRTGANALGEADALSW